MNQKEFIEALSLSVRLFVQQEQSLFKAYGDNLREEAISHQLACKIGIVFNNFDVDCEYSRQLDGNHKQNDLGEDKRPDIVIHKRGTDENNLALVEVKWNKNPEDDTAKVTMFKNLRYTFAVVIRFLSNGSVNHLKVYDYQTSCWIDLNA